MVHYELAESEWNLLDDCVKQMTLITDLCGHITSGSKTISVGGLESFISRQQDTLRETLRSVEERHQAQRVLSEGATERQTTGAASNLSIPIELLIRLMQTLSGADIDKAELMRTHDEFRDLAIQTASGEPLREFYKALLRAGLSISGGFSPVEINLPKPKAARKSPARKRERLMTAS